MAMLLKTKWRCNIHFVGYCKITIVLFTNGIAKFGNATEALLLDGKRLSISHKKVWKVLAKCKVSKFWGVITGNSTLQLFVCCVLFRAKIQADNLLYFSLLVTSFLHETNYLFGFYLWNLIHTKIHQCFQKNHDNLLTKFESWPICSHGNYWKHWKIRRVLLKPPSEKPN